MIDSLLKLTTPLPPFILRTEAQKRLAFNQAKKLVKDKGIINLGAGNLAGGLFRTPFAYSVAHSKEVIVNTDITPDGLSNFVQLDLERIPYPFNDKQFDVCFSSHILEHLENWQEALDEMRRIADYVVIAIPHPLDLFAALNPNHRQHFNFNDIKWLQEPPQVLVFY